MLTPHFSLKEFACKGTPVPDEYQENAKKLALILEEMRKIAGPIKVTSGYRTPEHNASLKGSSPTSHHLTCSACDIQSRDLAPGDLAIVALAIRANRPDLLIGEIRIYDKHLHISCTQDLRLSRG